MKILFDNGVPRPLRRVLVGHVVTRTQDLGWERFDDGWLLRCAEAGCDALVRTDQNIPFQQNLSGHHLAILILTNHKWPELRRDLPDVVAAVNALQRGTLVRFPESA